MSGSGEFRVGLLGLGAIAQVVHLPILHHMADVKLAAVCDVDQAKAKAIATRFGIERVARNDDEVFAADDLDAVVIATPSHLHETQCIAALQGGKHVLVEKPLSTSWEAADRVLRAAERAGKTLMVAMNNRYRPDTLALKPFAAGGELGTVFLARGAWLNRKMRLVRPTWRHRVSTAGGGALMDLGVQTLDLAMWFMDFPKVKSLVCYTHPGEGMEVEDSAAFILRLESGSAISLSLSWSLVADRDRHYMRLLGTRGSGNIQPLAVFKEIEHGMLDVTPQMPVSAENIYTASYRAELEDFVATAQGKRPYQPPVDQVELMRLIGLAYQSAKEERELDARPRRRCHQLKAVGNSATLQGLLRASARWNGAKGHHMKQGIHPQYQAAIVHCACGNKWETRSTQKDIHLDICSVCHPYFTGRQKLMDTAGRIERFRQKWGTETKAAKE